MYIFSKVIVHCALIKYVYYCTVIIDDWQRIQHRGKSNRRLQCSGELCPWFQKNLISTCIT